MDTLGVSGFLTGAIVGAWVWYFLRGRLPREDRLKGLLHVTPHLVRWLAALSIVALLLASGFVWAPVLWPEVHWFLLKLLWADAPVAGVLLGGVFGGAAAEWVSYIVVPAEVLYADNKALHSTWSYVLLIALAASIGLAGLSPLLRSLTGATIKTPVGSLEVAAQPAAQTPRERFSEGPERNQGNGSQHSTERPPLPMLADIRVRAKRDLDYGHVFLAIGYEGADGPNQFESLKWLHRTYSTDADQDINSDDPNGKWDGFLPEVLAPLGSCIVEHFKEFHNPHMLMDSLSGSFVAYADLVHHPERSADEQLSQQLKVQEELKQAADRLERDTDAQACKTARDRITAARLVPADLTLPYMAMGLAALYYDAGAIEAAAVEIARWIEEQYGMTAARHLRACNDGDQTTCNQVGFRPDGKSPRALLPQWYKVRALYELTKILESTPAVDTRLRIYKQTVDAYEEMFRETLIQSPDVWLQRCSGPLSEIEPTYKLNDKELELLQRNVLSYLDLVDGWLTFAADSADRAPAGDDRLITLHMLAYGKRNAQINLKCFFRLSSLLPPDGETIGRYRAHYGHLLLAAALQKAGTSDSERNVQHEMLKEARENLDEAVDLLRQRVDGEKKDSEKKMTADELLFYRTEAEDNLAAANQDFRRVLVLLKD